MSKTYVVLYDFNRYNCGGFKVEGESFEEVRGDVVQYLMSSAGEMDEECEWINCIEEEVYDYDGNIEENAELALSRYDRTIQIFICENQVQSSGMMMDILKLNKKCRDEGEEDMRQRLKDERKRQYEHLREEFGDT